MVGTNPCYECKHRTITCHAKCEKYNDWFKRWKEQKSKVDKYYRNRNVGYYHK